MCRNFCLGDKMKKNILILIALFVGSALFAQSAEYKDLLAKGQQYEQEKKWVHALGAYYDAMEAAPDLAEPFYAYKKLSEVIEAGNPGYGEFDDFSQYDGWIEIMQEYESYWSENIPRAIVFSDLTKTKMDMENRKVTYSVRINAVPTEKYSALEKVFSTGKEKAYKDSWVGYGADWPETSVYNSENDKKLSKKDGIPFIKSLGKGYKGFLGRGYGGLGKGLGSSNYPAFITDINLEASVSRYMVHTSSASLYEVSFRITDENNTSLFESGRVTVSMARGHIFDMREYKFIVSQDAAKIIESKKTKFVPTAVYLRYGVINEFTTEDSDYKWKKNLETLELPVSKVQFFVSEPDSKEDNGLYSSIFHTTSNSYLDCHGMSDDLTIKLGKYRYGREVLDIYEYNTRLWDDENELKKMADNIRLRPIEISNNGSVLKKLLKKKNARKIAIYSADTNFREGDSDSWRSTSYPSELAEYVFCNYLSKKENLTPCYKIPDLKNEPITELEAFKKYSDKIVCDVSANGYRRPSENEKEYLKSAVNTWYGRIYVRTISDK